MAYALWHFRRLSNFASHARTKSLSCHAELKPKQKRNCININFEFCFFVSLSHIFSVIYIFLWIFIVLDASIETERRKCVNGSEIMT